MNFSLKHLLLSALEEDIGSGDVTTEALVPPDLNGEAIIVAKSELIFSGVQVLKNIFKCYPANMRVDLRFSDGDFVKNGEIICTIKGSVSFILQTERVLLNILQRLCGIATYTRKIVEKIKGTNCKLLDTRKTTPLWRQLEKAAVRHGGGTNHRFGLFDGVLIKDNHIVAAGSIKEAVSRARRNIHHLLKIEVEVTSVEELEEAISAGADMVLLDNFSINELKVAVGICKGRVLCEASGRISIENARKIAETGVNFISCGALTHSAPAADLSLKLVRTF